jgi:hypothetical protein
VELAARFIPLSLPRRRRPRGPRERLAWWMMCFSALVLFADLVVGALNPSPLSGVLAFMAGFAFGFWTRQWAFCRRHGL